MADEHQNEKDTVWIESVRGPDGAPVCQVTWRGLDWYPPVFDVRATAIDLVTCAAYADMMMALISMGLAAPAVSKFAADLLSGTGRTSFGTEATLTLTPAGSSKRKEAVVLITHGPWRGMVSAAVARGMALGWLEAAEATESDRLVAEALRAARACDEPAIERVFGYLKELRSSETAAR